MISSNSAEKDPKSTLSPDSIPQPQSDNLKNKSTSNESPIVCNMSAVTDLSCNNYVNDSFEDSSFKEVEDFVMSVLEDCDKSKMRITS